MPRLRDKQSGGEIGILCPFSRFFSNRSSLNVGGVSDSEDIFTPHQGTAIVAFWEIKLSWDQMLLILDRVVLSWLL